MTSTRSHPTRTRGDTMRAAGAAVVLAAVLVGLPWLLATVAAPLYPGWSFTPDAMWRALTRPDDGTLFLRFLLVVAWVAWAGFALCVLVEIAAQIRRRPTVRLPGLGWAQMGAASLISAILLGFSSTTTLAAAEPLPDAIVATVTADASDAPVAEAAPASPCDSSSTATPTHVTDCHDTYVSIAASRLGDTDRYREVIALNTGRTMPDGTILTGDEFLEPDWELLLPADATPAQPVEPEIEPPPPVTISDPADTSPVSAAPAVKIAKVDAKPPRKNVPPPGSATPSTARDRHHDAPTALTQSANRTGQDHNSQPKHAPPPAPMVKTPTNPPDNPHDARAVSSSVEHENHNASETGEPATETASQPESRSDNSDPRPLSPSDSHPDSPHYSKEPEAEKVELASQDTEDAKLVAAITTCGALLAAGLIALVGARRLAQHRGRRPGHRIPQPVAPAVVRAEEDLRHHAEPGSVELLDQALRSLAATAATTGLPLPPLLGARVTARGCELLLSETGDDHASEAVAPFHAVGRYAWALDVDDDALLPPEKAAETEAPYPSLLTLGQDTTGAHLLVDLTQTGAINLTGTPEHVRQVLWALAVELATSCWADHVNATLVGFGSDLPALLPTGRLRHTTDVDACLDEIERLAHDLAADESDETCMPEIVLSAHPLSAEQMRRLRATTLTAPTLPLAIIAAATDDHRLPTDWTLDATPGNRVTLPVLGRAITLQHVTPAQQADLTTLLATTHAPDEPDPAWRLVPAEPPEPQPPASDETGPDTAAQTDDHTSGLECDESAPATPRVSAEPVEPPPANVSAEPAAPAHPTVPSPSPADEEAESSGPTPEPRTDGGPSLDQADQHRFPTSAPQPRTSNAPFIRVLGTIDIAGLDTRQLEAGKRRSLVELACLLALKPGQTPHDVSRTMGGPRGPWSASTRSASLSRLRSWLGRDTDGTQYFPPMKDGAYRLSATLGCDWTDFQRLARHGLAHNTPDGTQALHQAIDLVRGEPFSGTAPGRYAWAEPLKHTITAAIADTAHTIAVRALATGDLAPARAALIKILETDPVNELLYRDLIHLEHHANNPKAIDRAIQRLTIALDTLDLEMESATIELINRTMPR